MWMKLSNISFFNHNQRLISFVYDSVDNIYIYIYIYIYEEDTYYRYTSFPTHTNTLATTVSRFVQLRNMVQIHPVQAVPVDSGIGEVKSSPYVTTEQESFTIWMRSLVYHSKGCTVYDSKGNLIYRVDNYDSKSCGEVYLMDLYGEVLFEFQQKFGLFKSCEGYNSTGTRFRLRKNFKISPRGSSSSYKVVMESNKDDRQSCYKILNHASVFTIEDGSGRFMAEVKKKRSNVNGLDFGEDVLTMVVEPQVDHSFIMGIVIAYGLLKSKL